MSKSVNQCLIIGNVGKDPETRTLDNGVKVSTFSVATSTGGYKKQDGTDVPEKTSWHNMSHGVALPILQKSISTKGTR